MRALLLDLDDTLVVEERAAVAAFEATARFAAEHVEIDPIALAVDARACARDLWWAAPTHPYCLRVGISSWEGLWCRFEGDGDDLRALRAWAPDYRRESWAAALALHGVGDARLAAELGERFGIERRARHTTFDDVAGALEELAATHRLALLTNGASCLQREKLAASGLEDRFEVVVVSSELGTVKPDPAVFHHVLEALGADPTSATMVGDSLERDIAGALAAGLAAVWLNRDGVARPAEALACAEIRGLGELPALLAR